MLLTILIASLKVIDECDDVENFNHSNADSEIIHVSLIIRYILQNAEMHYSIPTLV